MTITATIFNNIKNAYNTPVRQVNPQDPPAVKCVSHTLNIGKRSCVVISAIICTIASPIFLFIDCLYLVLQKVYQIVKPLNSMDRAEKLLSFYRDAAPNTENRFLHEIWSWDDEKLESVHNYIQWLFPTIQQSGPNPSAPTLNAPAISCFQKEKLLQDNLLKSFKRMLTFYGLKIDENNNVLKIVRAPNSSARQAVWLTPSNHNFSRITRIIASLYTLGLKEHAIAFNAIMNDIATHEGKGVTSTSSLSYWQKAAQA
jgi:hypothetical protein